MVVGDAMTKSSMHQFLTVGVATSKGVARATCGQAAFIAGPYGANDADGRLPVWEPERGDLTT